VFKSGIDLVALNVVVTDASQKFVNGLQATDFSVYEDGVLQDVSFFASSVVPLDLALLLDTSASMTDKMATMQRAAVGFASTIREQDHVAIVDIKDTVRVAYPLGSEVAAAVRAIETTKASGGTALHNGVYITLKNLALQRRNNGEVRRQVIALLSDGEDTTSLVGFDEVLELAKQSGITIYTITLKRPGVMAAAQHPGRSFSQTDFSMKTLAQETGGRAFFPTQIAELAAIYEAIAEELAHQYAIGYTPKNPRPDGRYRRVIVKVLDRPDMRTRSRSGYLAARSERVAR
jgi:VWFA-related protein